MFFFYSLFLTVPNDIVVKNKGDFGELHVESNEIGLINFCYCYGVITTFRIGRENMRICENLLFSIVPGKIFIQSKGGFNS